MSRMSELWYERKTIMDAEGYHLPVAIQEAMTLRDQFAMAALTGLLTHNAMTNGSGYAATFAYEIADAMLKARQWLPEEEEE